MSAVMVRSLAFALVLCWADFAVGSEEFLPHEKYYLYLSKCETPLPRQFSESALKTLENGQLTCFTFEDKKEYDYEVVQDTVTGLLTVDCDDSLYLVIRDKNARSVTVRNTVRETSGRTMVYYAVNDAGHLCSAHADHEGNVQLSPITVTSSSPNDSQKDTRNQKAGARSLVKACGKGKPKSKKPTGKCKPKKKPC